MSNQTEPQITATDLPLTLYLNQRLTFDLLAILEGGFSNFATVQTTSSGETTTELSGGAQLGVSNIFAFLNVKLGGHGSRRAEQQLTENTTENIVHTPASLFARLRQELKDRDLVHYVSPSHNLNAVHPSDFVEFEATLRKSPLTEMLSAFSGLLPLIELAEEEPAPTTSQTSRNRNERTGKSQRKQNEVSVLQKKIGLFQSAVTVNGSQDFIAEMGSMRVVLTTEQEYFIDPSMNDTIDGMFRVFGKVTRVIPDDSDEINLLRKTALGKFGNIVKELGPVMASMQGLGFGGSLETEIRGPTMQIFPIAIFS